MPESAVTPVEPDPDQRVSARPRAPWRRRWPVLAAISAGGVVGGVARHGLTEAFGPLPGGFPWVTFAINVSGCLLIGVLMVLLNEVWTGQRLLRPFVGVGVLGGFTTFSAYVVDIQQTVAAERAGAALAYLAATVLAALTAVWVGSAVTAGVMRAGRASRRPQAPR